MNHQKRKIIISVTKFVVIKINVLQTEILDPKDQFQDTSKENEMLKKRKGKLYFSTVEQLSNYRVCVSFRCSLIIAPYNNINAPESIDLQLKYLCQRQNPLDHTCGIEKLLLKTHFNSRQFNRKKNLNFFFTQDGF